jgi:hypothetical protein
MARRILCLSLSSSPSRARGELAEGRWEGGRDGEEKELGRARPRGLTLSLGRWIWYCTLLRYF